MWHCAERNWLVELCEVKCSISMTKHFSRGAQHSSFWQNNPPPSAAPGMAASLLRPYFSRIGACTLQGHANTLHPPLTSPILSFKNWGVSAHSGLHWFLWGYSSSSTTTPTLHPSLSCCKIAFVLFFFIPSAWIYFCKCWKGKLS